MRAQLPMLGILVLGACAPPPPQGGGTAPTGGTTPTATASGTVPTGGTATGGTATGTTTGPIDDGGLDFVCSRVFSVRAGVEATVEVTEGGVPAPVLEGIWHATNLDAQTVTDRCAAGDTFTLEELGWDGDTDSDSWVEAPPLVVDREVLVEDVPLVLSFYQPVACFALLVPAASEVTTSVSFEAPAGALRGD